MITDEIRKVGVFIKRDFRMLFTYKLALSTTFFSIFFNLFYLVLFGSMFGSRGLPALAPYGGDFISYIIVGSIGWGFLWGIMGSTSGALRSEMMQGTLESVILTSTRITTITWAYTIFGCFTSLLSIGLVLLIGFFCFDVVAFTTASIYTLIIFVLSAVMMTGIGMIFGGLTIWVKNIGTLAMLTQSIAMFFCGVYFPVTVLPAYLQPIAKYVPFYYSMEGLRKSLIPATPESEIIRYIIILLILSISFILIGIYTLHKGLNKAKKDGSLVFY